MIYSQNHENLFFIEISMMTEYSTHSEKNFSSPKYDEEHFHFLNHVNPTKIEENIGPSDPPQKPQKGGSDTVNRLDFGYVSRRIL